MSPRVVIVLLVATVMAGCVPVCHRNTHLAFPADAALEVVKMRVPESPPSHFDWPKFSIGEFPAVLLLDRETYQVGLRLDHSGVGVVANLISDNKNLILVEADSPTSRQLNSLVIEPDGKSFFFSVPRNAPPQELERFIRFSVLDVTSGEVMQEHLPYELASNGFACMWDAL
jgi:hypothetical protein